MTLEELREALKAETADIRKAVAAEVDSAKKNSRLLAIIAVGGTILAAVVSSTATYIVATRKIVDIAAQAQADMERSAHQKLFEEVFSQPDRSRLRDSLALLVIGDLVDMRFKGGICEVIRAELDDAPTDCREAALLVVRPIGRASPQSRAAAAAAIGAGSLVTELVVPGSISSVSLPAVAPDLGRAIEDLGADEGAIRIIAAQKLSSYLNDNTQQILPRLATFAALVRSTALPVYTSLNLNARYNTFVVLSEVRPLKEKAMRDPQGSAFSTLAGELVRNVNAILAASQNAPDLAGTKTRKQIDQVRDRLGEFLGPENQTPSR